MKLIIDYIVYKALCYRNFFKYRVWSRKKLNFLTLKEICETLGVDIPKGKERKANKRYFVCYKRMHLLNNSIVLGNNVLDARRAKLFNMLGSIVINNTDNYGYQCIKVDDIRKAYIALISRLYNTRNNEITIITTGSTGKTTSKQFVNKVVSDIGRTFCEEQNMNLLSFQGTFVQFMPRRTRFWVQEVDEGEIGELADSSKMLHPEIAIITNVGTSHMKNFKSKEHIAENMSEITMGMKKESLLIYNQDDELLNKREWPTRSIGVSLTNKNADCYSSDVKTNSVRGIDFTVNYAGHSHRLTVNVPGRHNIYNAMYAYLVGLELGQKEDEIAKSILKYNPTGVRQNTLKTEDGSLLYVDCFNAAPDSVKVALETIEEIDGYDQRIAIIGDVLEAGEAEEAIHKEVASHINKIEKTDYVICCGERAKIIYDTISNDNLKAFYASNTDEASRILKQITESKKSVILFKSSRGIKFENIIKNCYQKTYKTIMKQNKLLKYDI